MAEAATRPREQARTVAKAVEVLEVLAREPDGLTVSQLARAMGENRAVIYRMINALAERRLVERDPQTLKYRLGTGLLSLASAVHRDIRRTALPTMQRLVELTNETAFLSVCHGEEAVCIERVNSPLPFRVNYDVGSRHPLGAGAPGKLFLAYLDRAARDESTMPVNGFRHPAARPLDAHELSRIRRQGYAFSSGELQPGASGLAAPVFNHQGWMVASLGLVGPAIRWDEVTTARNAELLLEACREISGELGYRGTIPPV